MRKPHKHLITQFARYIVLIAPNTQLRYLLTANNTLLQFTLNVFFLFENICIGFVGKQCCKAFLIIMTSNVGSDIIQSYMDRLPDAGRKGASEAEKKDASEKRSEMLSECKSKILELLKQTIRPEFLNRIDEIIMFEPLTKSDIRDILHIQMAQLQHKLSEDGVEISFTEAFEDYMTDKGYDPAFGARPIKRVMQRELVNQLAKAILDGSVHKDSAVEADVENGEIVLRNKPAETKAERVL